MIQIRRPTDINHHLINMTSNTAAHHFVTGIILDTAIHCEYKDITTGIKKFCIASPFMNI